MLQPINNARTLSGPGFQDLDIWLSGPRFQDLNTRFQDLALRTWVSGLRYLALRTRVSGPRKLSILRSSYLFPVTFLCVHRHFSLRPSSLFSTSNGHRRTDARTDALCFHVWICSQVWLKFPSENCPLFRHLPTDDGHFGYKQTQVVVQARQLGPGPIGLKAEPRFFESRFTNPVFRIPFFPGRARSAGLAHPSSVTHARRILVLPGSLVRSLPGFRIRLSGPVPLAD